MLPASRRPVGGRCLRDVVDGPGLPAQAAGQRSGHAAELIFHHLHFSGHLGCCALSWARFWVRNQPCHQGKCYSWCMQAFSISLEILHTQYH